MGTLLLLFLILILAALAGAMVTIALVQSRRPPRQLPPPAGPDAPAWQQQVGPSQFPVYNPINYLSPGDRERILVLLRGGKKIHAIKLYREVTGAGLREAKEAVEHLDRFQ